MPHPQPLQNGDILIGIAEAQLCRRERDKDLDLRMPPIRMPQNDVRRKDHQIGIPVVIARQPDFDEPYHRPDQLGGVRGKRDDVAVLDASLQVSEDPAIWPRIPQMSNQMSIGAHSDTAALPDMPWGLDFRG